jgi:hypothetical protein
MDKFEQVMQDLATMPEDERTRVLSTEMAKCICSTCPTYTDCAKNAQEAFFCGNGRSFMCITFDRGCVCPTCPVAADLGLGNDRYCLRGSEKARRYETALWGTKMV